MVFLAQRRCIAYLFVVCFVFSTFLTGSAFAANSGKSAPSFKEQKARVRGREASGYRIIVKFKSGQDAHIKLDAKSRRTALTKLGESIVREYKHISDIVVLELVDTANISVQTSDKQRGVALEQRIKQLKASGLVEFAEPDWVVYALATPTDSAFTDGRLWGLRNYGQSGGVAGADIGAVSAWDITTGDPSIIVGIIDTGIRYTHQDLAANMWINPGEIDGNGIDDDLNGYVDDVYGINAITGSGNPMDDNGHGSHCAGTIGAVANGGGPHVGVAWNVSLMGLKFLSANGSGYSSDAVACVDYAISKNVDILSNSWGGGGYSSAMEAAIQRANAAGILFVAAAGNESNNNDSNPGYPANYNVENVISVAALDRSDNLASFSNYGAQTVDLGAPGVSIYSCTSDSDSSYDFFNGTSMATPHVSGVAALIAAQFPGISVANMRQRLLSTTVAVASLSGKAVTGGRVNAASALNATSDNILEVSVSAENNPLIANELNSVYVQVSDLTPVLGATVAGTLEGQSSVSFFDNGIAPDATINDGIYSANLAVPGTSGEIDLVVVVSATGKQSASVTNTFSIVGKPANDDFKDRITVATGTTAASGSSLNATLESGEPRYYYGAGYQTVWWVWTATTTESVSISTLGSDFDTILSIYTGSSLGSLIHIGSNDDSGGLQSVVSFAAQAGVTYAIQVNGYGSATGEINLNLPAQAGTPTIIDEPDNVSVLIGNPFSLQVIAEGQTPFSYQWYFDDLPILGETNSTYSVASAELVDEGYYKVSVSNAIGLAMSRNALVSVEQVDIQPGSDHFATAYILTNSSGRVIGENTLATGETGEPNHGGVSLPLNSLWFKFIAPLNGRLSINTFGSDFDTVLAAYQGNTVSSLSLIADNDDADSLQSKISFVVTEGLAYYIAVDGYENSVGTATLDYYLTSGYATSDYDGDGSSDLAVFGTEDASWFVRTLHDTAPVYGVNWGWSGVEPVSGDFDGDGVSDLAIFDQNTGRWFIRTLDGGILAWEMFWGWPGVQPIAGDYDGDGIDDLAIFDQNTGRWFIRSISGDIIAWEIFWGWPGVQPISGDYDGDGIDDLAIFDQNTGRWFIRSISGDIIAWEVFWGWPGVEAVAGDYDGDKQSDLAIFDTLSARWFIRTLVGPTLGWDINWGWPGVVPVSGDYDGDGISDLAIYDEASGRWYIRTLSGTILSDGIVWGDSGFIPVSR